MSQFRTTEISNPKFESNNLRFITVRSENLKSRGDICVFVPPFSNLKNTPIITLLHGVYGSAWIWTQKAGVHITALKMMEQGVIEPMIIAMPSDGFWGDGSAYLNHDGLGFEKWVTEDVIAAVKENIPTCSDKSPLFISGLSMGGFGAMHIGAKYGKQYKAISGHSSITNLNQMPLFVKKKEGNYWKKKKTENSIFKTILKYKDSLPKLHFDCGKDDLLFEYNKKLHQKLEAENIQHSYQVFEGSHDWDYWENHIKDTLLFFSAVLSE